MTPLASTAPPRRRLPLQPWLLALTQVYFTALFGLTILRLVAGDRWWWLFALNSLTLYWFLPLPVALVMAVWTRRREIWLGVGVGALLWAALYGGLFLPRGSKPQGAGPAFTVLTSNLLGFNPQSAAIVEALRASQADLIALQELSPDNAAAIERELTAAYPYQRLHPAPDVTGSGILSRYPIQPTGETLPGGWIGLPDVLTMTVGERAVTVVHFHAYAGINNAPGRQQQAQILAEFVRQHPGPLIALGDLNSTDMSAAYGTVTRQLRDAWRAAGWGFGHTFPGSADTPGNMRPHLAGLAVPPWLLRIDYIFYSTELAPQAAHIGPWDGASDHRPVWAEFVFAP